MKLFLAIAASLLFVLCANAQSTSYFQQEVNYKIEVTMDDSYHFLHGKESFEYINNSPDTLTFIYIHLWPNAYKNSKTALAKQKFASGDYFLLWASQKERGYIDSLNFTVDGKSAETAAFENYEDIMILHLPQPLLPGKKITVDTPFRVKLPSGTISRLGHIGQSYQITQWYPKPAVYDRNGWHQMPYLNQGEFYSEFGSFDVRITLPDNYTVGATGDLQTREEILRLDSLANMDLSGTKQPKENFFPPSSTNMKTLHYKQNNVHDFGWFADKRWLVRKGEVELPHSKRKVTTWAMFTPESKDLWSKTAIKSINDGLYYYSLWSGDYPYNQCTAVDGTISAGGGMEYPNVTVIGSTSNEQSLATVIIHEVGHNWFYGILGSNERTNAWMDEGMNSFFESRTILATNPNPSKLGAMVGTDKVDRILKLDNYPYQYINEEVSYLLSARTSNDQPIQLHSADYTGLNYGTIVYKKSALAFNYLLQYLGEEEFNRCMSIYFEQWKFKHPSPSDLRGAFESTSGKNLNWFFDELIPTTGLVDYKLKNIKRKDQGYVVTVKNHGDISSPFSLDLFEGKKMIGRVWYDGIESRKKTKVFIAAAETTTHISVNDVTGIPEYDRKNNTSRTKGIFRKVEPLQLSFFSGIDKPDKTEFYWLPLLAWNDYNKWMLGVSLHNQPVPARNFFWNLSPMYSIAANNLNGFAHVGFKDGIITYGIRAQKFSENSYWYKDSYATTSYTLVAPYIRAKLFRGRAKQDWSGTVKAEWILLGRRIKNSDTGTLGNYVGYDFSNPDGGGELSHVRVKLNLKKKMLRTTFAWQSTVEGGEYTDYGLFHQHSLEADYIYRGQGKKKIRTRLYYGGGADFMLYSAGQFGASDYAYDGLFLGRNNSEGILAQQFLRTQGAMAIPTFFGANNGLATINAEIDLPVKLPIAIYAGAAWLNNKGFENYPNQIFNAGLSFPIVRNVFQIYMPLAYSKEVRNEMKARDLSFGETILFELNLNLINPFGILRNLDL